MRKQITTKKLSRTSNERKRLAQSLVMELIMKERIVTTHAKAQFGRRLAEKLVTLAKNNSLFHRQLLIARLPNVDAVRILVEEIGPRFANRPGGYTRILKLDTRMGDAAQQVVLEWVEKKKIEPPPIEKPKSLKDPQVTKVPKKSKKPTKK